MGRNRNWTPEEEEAYLCENWGYTSIDGICKRLGRSKNAIMIRVQKLGLSKFLESGDYITMHQLVLALGYGASDSYKVTSWIENRGFPVRTKVRSSNARIRVVYIEDFWEWAEKNRSFIDFSRMEPLALGAEPAWLPEQRRNDYNSYALQRKDPWTPNEDSRLKMLLKQQRYGYAELSNMLRRSAGAIQRRINDLGLKERPVKADGHGASAQWTPEHFQILADGIRSGLSYTMIGNKIGKSEKAIRGKVYTDYLTENADKVRAMLGNGKWGNGAPLPTVKQAVHHSRYRIDTKEQLERLAGLALLRLRQLRKDDYFWQKEVCQHWSDVAGCTKGCSDCDICPEFVRIKPQYCCRCGATFLDRTQQKFCPSCRSARRKQAQRKWARLHNQ